MATETTELDLPTGILNALRRKGIQTVEELRKLTGKELMSIRTIGPKRVKQIEEALAAFGGLRKELKRKPIEVVPASYFEEPLASVLEEKRAVARAERRITYDCFNAIVKGSSVSCKMAYRFGARTYTMPVLSVLKGRSNKTCQACPDYDDGEIKLDKEALYEQ